MSIKDNVSGQEQVSLDKNSALLSLLTLWWNPPHALMGDFREILVLFSPSLSWQPHWPHRELPVPLWDPASHLRCPNSHFCCPHGLCGSFTVAPSLHSTSLFQIPSHARQFVLPHSCEALDTEKQNVNAVYELAIKDDAVLGFHTDTAGNTAHCFYKNKTVNSSETTFFAQTFHAFKCMKYRNTKHSKTSTVSSFQKPEAWFVSRHQIKKNFHKMLLIENITNMMKGCVHTELIELGESFE